MVFQQPLYQTKIKVLKLIFGKYFRQPWKPITLGQLLEGMFKSVLEFQKKSMNNLPLATFHTTIVSSPSLQ